MSGDDHRRAEVLASKADLLVLKARGLYARAAKHERAALTGISKATHPRTHKIIAASAAALLRKVSKTLSRSYPVAFPRARVTARGGRDRERD